MALKDPLDALASKPGFKWMQTLGPNMISIFIIFALLYWVGMARIVGDGGDMYLIVDVMVHPDHQKQGIGRMLLERINGFLGDLASDGRVLMVNLMATPGNEGFYEKFGYVRRPNEEMGSGMVRWINR